MDWGGRTLTLLVFALLVASFQTVNSLTSEANILLKMKHAIADARGSLSNWNTSTDSPCHWNGVQCNNQGFVTGLEFPTFFLNGSVPSIMCQLPNLVHVNFYYNNFGGSFPAELLSCIHLTYLNLSQNWIVGTLPVNLDQMTKLQVLDLSSNCFSGPIPEAFGRLPELLRLGLNSNNLYGTIPPFLGQLVKLQDLSLAYNPFSAGRIPSELGRCTELTYLWLTNCSLVDEIPDIFRNLTKLTNLDLAQNRLTGNIPSSLMNLRFLYQLELYQNQLSGPIPQNLGNLSSIVNIDMQQNQLTGPIPQSISQLQNLSSLHLSSNLLSGEIPDGLADLPLLQDLTMFNNRFCGALPQSLGKSSQLKLIDLSYNEFDGPLPPHICASGTLLYLILMQNHFSGAIPESYARCNKVIRLRLSKNELSGRVPKGLWGLPALFILDLAVNKLEGDISPFIANAIGLSIIYLENNAFSGGLPAEMGNLNLSVITLQNNRLFSPIPRELGKLQALYRFQLQYNSLSGEIPAEIGACSQLTSLDLSYNQLTGPIPSSLGDLLNLNTLDLSNNRLTGEIPSSLAKLNLIDFNVSNNRLSGPVPGGLIFAPFYTSFLDNQGLCGENLSNVKPCKSKKTTKLLEAIVAGTFAAALIILLSGLAWFWKRFQRYDSTNKGGNNSDKSGWSVVTFHKMKFSVYEILAGLDEDNVIGKGGTGKIYKATLRNNRTVAIKRLRKSAGRFDDGVIAELKTLKEICHRNIVKLFCCCYNSESILLVCEYMGNSNLGNLLHGVKESIILDAASRYKIALGAAQGLAYLHHACSPPILHRDFKSSNVLLDSDFEAHVSDYGLAKILERMKCGDSTTELGTNPGTNPGDIELEHVSSSGAQEKGDIYGFGVVLLELVTGKKPTDVPEFGEGCDIVKWVWSKLQDEPERVIDPRLVSDACRDDMFLVLKVAILCTRALPMERPSMRKVVEMLEEASTSHDPELKGFNDCTDPIII